LSPVVDRIRAVEARKSELAGLASLKRRETRHALGTLIASVESWCAALLENVRSLYELAGVVAQSPDDVRRQHAPKVMQDYRAWLDEARELIKDVDRLRSHGLAVTGAEQLLHESLHVQMLIDSSDRLIAAGKNLDEGRGIPMAEAFDELRRRAGA
jgi:hypothetical protein